MKHASGCEWKTSTTSLHGRPNVTARRVTCFDAGPAFFGTFDAHAPRSLPCHVRNALELLSGFDMCDVRVHYDSPLPARMGARGFAYGIDIHLAPGAEDALEHEAWHVAQQKQGRVNATRRMGALRINDDNQLEDEAELMAESLRRLCLTDVSSRSVLRAVTIKNPVVQLAVTIGTRTYTSSRTDFEALCKYVTDLQASKLGDRVPELFPAETMADILVDFVQDNETFVDDAALLREVAIRNVGYRAEAMMRRLMVANTKIMVQKQIEYEKFVTAARQQWALDERAILYADRKYKTDEDLKHAIGDARDNAQTGFLKWTSASYFVMTKHSEVAHWVLDRSTDDPLAMNCWEGTLYSLVKTGLVPKNYLIWANMTSKTTPVWHVTGEMFPTQFMIAVMKVRDYYWSVADGPLDTIDRRSQRTGWTDGEVVCIPAEVKIPRGRLVIMNFGGHVAISTGKSYRIATEKARDRFGMSMGHGILELDKPDADSKEVRTIRETTIEDLVSMGGTYLKHIAIAPFPSIATSYSTTSTEDVQIPTLDSVQAVIDKFFVDNASKIEKDRKKQADRDASAINRTKSALSKVEATTPIDARAHDRLSKQLESQEKAAQFEQESITTKWKRLAMDCKDMKLLLGTLTIKRGMVQLPIMYAYDAIDPYHGLVEFPEKT